MSSAAKYNSRTDTFSLSSPSVVVTGCKHCKSPSNPNGDSIYRNVTVTDFKTKRMVKGICSNTGQKGIVFLDKKPPNNNKNF